MKVWVYQIYDDIDSIFASKEGLKNYLRNDPFNKSWFENAYEDIMTSAMKKSTLGWIKKWRAGTKEEAWEDYLERQGQEFEVQP